MNINTRLVLWCCSALFFLVTIYGCSPATPVDPAEKPDAATALKILQEGNIRFYTGKAEHPHTDTARLQLAGKKDQGKYAYATVLTCSDSRVPVEMIFDAGVMDIFVIRVAGNVCNIDEAGSIVYGLTHVHTPLLVVLGHSRCGAVAAAAQAKNGNVDGLERNIQPLVTSIIPAVNRARQDHPDVQGDAIVPYATEENVWLSIENLFMKSPAVRSLVTGGNVKVVGAIYDVGTGKVTWLPEALPREILKRVEAASANE